MLEPNINYITESLGDDIGTDNITDLFQSSKDSDEVCEATISDTHIGKLIYFNFCVAFYENCDIFFIILN